MNESRAYAQAIEEFRSAAQAMSRPSIVMRSLIADRAGLNATDAECIDYLMSNSISTASDLARATRLSKSAITSVLQRLEKAGYITRHTSSTDRRSSQIQPNIPLIQAKFGPYYKAVTNEFQKIVADYDLDQLELLTKHYKRMTQLYEQQVKLLSDPKYEGHKDS